MATIWKFQLDNVAPRQMVTVPIGARPIHAGPDPNGYLCMWALVDPSAHTVERAVHIYGTGSPVPDRVPLIHLGSYLSGPFMWHVFVEGP